MREDVITPFTGESYDFSIVNVDTDAISICKQDGKKFTDEECDLLMDELNSQFPELIEYEDDGYFEKFIVVKAKNYIMEQGTGKKKKITIKGSGLKGTNREKALTEFLNNVIMLLLNNKRDHIFNDYNAVAKEIEAGFEDINQWAMKKTVTKAVLNPERAQESKVLDAIQNVDYQEGDKVYLYCKDKDTLQLAKEFDGEYDKATYFKKLHNTLKIFETLVDPTLYPNYGLGRNKTLI